MEHWKKIKLGNVILDLIGGGTPSTKEESYWIGNIPWMTSAHITSKEIFTGQRKISESGLNESATKLIPANNLLIASRVGIGKAAINRIDVAISQDLTGVVLDRSRILPEYVYWWLTLNQNKLKSLAQGSTIKGILKEDLAKLELELPSLNIQKEICDILNLVDDATQKADEAIEHTERLKRGLMLKLLTQGIGHIEFKETKIGRIPKEWEVVKLRDTLKNGELIELTTLEQDKNYIDISSINNKSFTIENTLLINKSNAPSRARKLVKTGDVIFATTRPNLKNIAVVPMHLDGQICSTGFCVLRPNEFLVTTDWLFYNSINNKFVEKVSSKMKGATYPAVNDTDIKNELIPLPNLKEQAKINMILNEVTKKLLFERRRKESWTRIKQGLMNDLLTGKKRVMLS